MYVKQHDDRERSSVEPDKAFMETFSHKDFKIQFIGVWDTVSSVGWITSPLRLFNLAQNGSIVRGRHAISIDEHRCFFQDNLWGDPFPGRISYRFGLPASTRTSAAAISSLNLSCPIRH